MAAPGRGAGWAMGARSAAVVTALAVGACHPGSDASGDGAAGGAAAPPDTVRAVVSQHLTYAPLMLAREAGDFAARGLEVEFLSFETGTQLIPLLLSGDLDVLPQPITPGLLRAIDQGARLRLVAGKGLWETGTCDTSWLVVRSDLFDPDPAVTLARPGPRRISVARTAWSRYFAETALAREGLELDRFETVHLQALAELDAFADGTVDAAVTSEPYLTRALDAGHARRWIAGSEVLPDFQLSYFTFGPTLLDERPEVGERFLAAYLDGVRRLRRGKTEENLRILAEGTGQEPELLRRACWPTFRDDGGLSEASLRAFQAWLVDVGMLDRVLDSEEYWDSRFLEGAAELRVRPSNP